MTELPPIIVWNLIEALSDVADGPYQTRLWQASEGEVSNFTEALEAIFGDTFIRFDLDKGRQVYDPEIDAELSRLRTEMGNLGEASDWDPRIILASDEIVEIRQLAADILYKIIRIEAIRFRMSDPSWIS
jgi:hypothetical protein